MIQRLIPSSYHQFKPSLIWPQFTSLTSLPAAFLHGTLSPVPWATSCLEPSTCNPAFTTLTPLPFPHTCWEGFPFLSFSLSFPQPSAEVKSSFLLVPSFLHFYWKLFLSLPFTDILLCQVLGIYSCDRI